MREFEVTVPISSKEERYDFRSEAAKALGVSPSKVGEITLLRKSVDARSNQIVYRLRLQAWLIDEKPEERYVCPDFKNVVNSPEVIIAGAGPAGIFAALKLLELGIKPVIIERGKDVHSRKYDIAAINREQIVNPDSGYCFGEGGAGTFSDGKLYTRSVKRGNVYEVLSRLIDAGASNSIMTDSHPHIGTDVLPKINEKIREVITSYGGEYYFGERITDIMTEGGVFKGVKCKSGSQFNGKALILATGHSARDIYKLLSSRGLPMEMKGFALGVRVEHQQSLINSIQYHGRYQPFMPNAEYSLVSQASGRGVFSFCMCPGGVLVPASTSPGELVLNGMSNSMRNSKWANSGIVVSINPGDIPEFDKYGIFSLLEFQSKIEVDSFDFGGGNLKAPAQRITDFLKGRVSERMPSTSYVPGVLSADLNELLPKFISSRLKEAMYIFDRKMRGFITEDSLMLATESRTSSPVRIPRDAETLEYLGIKRVFPCGEGAGYAGGIVSSALDGINAALAVSRLPL